MAIAYGLTKTKKVGETPIVTQVAEEEPKEAVKGGFLGGLGYLGEKFASSAVQSVEGAVDYIGAGVNKMFGKDKRAEEIIANDWFGDWYTGIDEKYNPNQVMKVAGDVAGGIGTSAPSMLIVAALTAAAAGLTALAPATGGASAAGAAGAAGAAASTAATAVAGVAKTAQAVSTLAKIAKGVQVAAKVAQAAQPVMAGLGAAGTATKEAYQKTGELSGKEFGYGAGVGAIEGGLEAAGNLLGVGSGAVMKRISGKAAQSVTKTGIVKGALKNFGSEAFEEGMAEFLNPYVARATYDPNAENASVGEIAYASFIGGVSGSIFGSVDTSVGAISNRISGGKLAGQEGMVMQTLRNAEMLMDETSAFPTTAKTRDTIRKIYNEVKMTSDQAGTMPKLGFNQKGAIGALNTYTTAAVLNGLSINTANDIISNPARYIDRFNSLGYVDANGNPMQFTVEGLLKGLEGVQGLDGKARSEAIAKALRSNPLLRVASVASVAGTMSLNPDSFVESVFERGFTGMTAEDIDRFAKEANDEQRATVQEMLGIPDLRMISAEEFAARAASVKQMGGAKYYQERKSFVKEMEGLKGRPTRKIPKGITIADGSVVHYKDVDADIAIKRTGDTYSIYDYDSKVTLRGLSKAAVNDLLQEYRANADAKVETETKTEQKPKKIVDENYKNADIPDKHMSIDEALQKEGITRLQKKSLKALKKVAKELDVKMRIYESPLVEQRDNNGNIVKDKDGNPIMVREGANGMFDPNTDTIYIDLYASADGKGTMLFTASHELTHFVKKWNEAEFNVFQDFLEKHYLKSGQSFNQLARIKMREAKADGRSITFEVAMEEVVADTCEKMLSDPDVVAKLTAQKKTHFKMVSKVVNWLKTTWQKLTNMYHGVAPDSYEANYFAAMEEAYDNVKGMWVDLVKGAKTNYQAAETSYGNVKTKTVLEQGRIHSSMSDAKRAEILSAKQIVAPIYTGQADAEIVSNKQKLESGKIGIVAGVIQKLGEDFGVVSKEINIKDVEVVITLSKSNLRKSVTADATPEQLAKLIPVLKEVAQNAIGIERHDNRYYFDSDTVYFDNLLGGYIDGNDFVPVRFGLKHSRTGNSVLYVVVDQNKIPLSSLEETKKAEVVKTPALQMQTPEASRSATYSIAQIVKFVNSGDLLRYVPDEMLSDLQKETKYEAISKTIEKTNTKNDERYREHVKAGNLWEAKQMVLAAAEANGYSKKMWHETDAQNIHVFDVSLNTHGGTDSETPYGIFTKSTDKSIGLGGRQMPLYVKAEKTLYVKDREDVKNKIPALVPFFNRITEIDKKYDALSEKYENEQFDALGEWMDEHPDADMDVIFPTSYIIEHKPADVDSEKYLAAFERYEKNRAEWESEYNKVAEQTKKMITFYLRKNGYDSMYFELDGGSRGRQTDSLILLDSNQVKSAETITYDDNGDIIPLSKRFDSAKSDIRYSSRPTYSHEGLTEADIASADEVVKRLRDMTQFAKYGIRKVATYTDDRMEQEIQNASSKEEMDYAKSYMAWVTPEDFIAATTMTEESRERIKTEAGKLDLEKLQKQKQPIYLHVDFSTGEIVGHEGRHRMLALQDAGISRVAVIIDATNDDRKHTKPIEIKWLGGQNFKYAKGLGFYLHDALPLSKRYADVAKEMFAFEGKEGVKFQSRSKEGDYSAPISEKDVEILRSIGLKSVNSFTSEDIKKAQKWAYKFYKELGVKSPFFRAWFGDWRAQDEVKVNVVPVQTIDISHASLSNGNYLIEDTGWNVYAGKTLNDDTRHHSGGNRINVKALNSIEAILSNSILLDTIVSERDTKKKSKNTAFLHKLYALIRYGGQDYIAKSTIEEYYNETIRGISRRAYNLKAIKIEPVGGQIGIKSSSSIPDTSSIISIADLYAFVKSHDKDFSAAPEVNKLMLERGRPKMFYHGTKEDFTVFDRSKLVDTLGFYFTEDIREARDYGNTHGYYLNVRNPIDIYSDEYFDKYNGIKNTEDRVETIKADGYDGIASYSHGTQWIIAFEPTQIKSATDNIGTFDKGEQDVKLQTRKTYTAGQYQKGIASKSKARIYSKGASIELMKRITMGTKLTQETLNDMTDAVWEYLNKEQDDPMGRDAVAENLADVILEKMLMEGETPNANVNEAKERLSMLRTGIRRLDIRDRYKGDLKFVLDKDGYRKFMARWGLKQNVDKGAYPMDLFVTDIAREVPGLAYLEEMETSDAMLEIDKLYDKAMEEADKKYVNFIDVLSGEEVDTLRKEIANTLKMAFADDKVRYDKTAFVDDVGTALEAIDSKLVWKYAEHEYKYGYPKAINRVIYAANKIKDVKKRKYKNASEQTINTFDYLNKELGSIVVGSNLRSAEHIRLVMADVLKWYNNRGNEVLSTENAMGEKVSLYDTHVADMLTRIADGTGQKFTVKELKMVHDVLMYFANFEQRWRKVYRDGKWVDALPVAQKYYDTMQMAGAILRKNVLLRAGTGYMKTFSDPASVARRFDAYQDGFFTEMHDNIRQGAKDAAIAEMDRMREYDEFLKKNKSYLEKATDEVVVFRGHKIPRITLISLYMTLKRQQAMRGIIENGFRYSVDDKHLYKRGERTRRDTVVTVQGFVKGRVLSDEALEQTAATIRSEIEKNFSDLDKQYIKILEHSYNVKLRSMKEYRDIQRMGISNVADGYYYPIRRDLPAKNVDANSYMDDLDTVSNASFNKDIVKGAKQALYIDSADIVYRRHAKSVCKYTYLSPAIEQFNTLYGLAVNEDSNAANSIATAARNTWKGGFEFFAKMIKDIEGVRTEELEASALSAIRSGYAVSVLAANLKVLPTQLSSIFASLAVLDPDCLTKGIIGSAKDVDKYCRLAELRSYENTAAKAQALASETHVSVSKGVAKTQKVGEVLMTPIGTVDRFVVCRLFGACQVQAQKNGDGKIGTVENKVAAGKLLEKVIFETQQNTLMTEKSAAMRAGQILKALTMFSSDAMKVVGRVIDGFGEIVSISTQMKMGGDKEKLKIRLRAAWKKELKAILAMFLNCVWMTAIARLFAHIYNKDEQDSPIWKLFGTEDESEPHWMKLITDMLGGMVSGLPVVRDVMSFVTDGFEPEDMTYSAVNDLMSSVSSLVTGIAKGTPADMMRAMRQLTYSVSAFLGIPSRNLYNTVYGFMKRFDEPSAYKVDEIFYDKNYRSDFYKAIDEGNNQMSDYLLGLALGERIGEELDKDVFNELLRLSKEGRKIMPKDVPDKITIDGEERILTPEEQATIQEKIFGCNDSLSVMMSTARYQYYDDETKEKAVNYVFDLYRDKAIYETIGVRRMGDSALLGAISANTLSYLYIKTDGEHTRANVVRTILKTNCNANQKLLLIYAKGYSLKDGEINGITAKEAKARLAKYINSLKMSKARKEELAKKCGFKVQNGKIILK
jgi:hypothetical protein